MDIIQTATEKVEFHETEADRWRNVIDKIKECPKIGGSSVISIPENTPPPELAVDEPVTEGETRLPGWHIGRDEEDHGGGGIL